MHGVVFFTPRLVPSNQSSALVGPGKGTVISILYTVQESGQGGNRGTGMGGQPPKQGAKPA